MSKTKIVNFKPVKGFEGYYLVSDNGIVKSIDRKVKNNLGIIMTFPSKIKKHQIDKDGYEYVSLCKNGKNYIKRVHRLVAEAFLDNPNNEPVINHKNEIKNDNRVENLEWCSIQYNNSYGNKTKNTRKKVSQFDENGNYIRSWDCIMEASNYYGIHRSCITEVCKNRRLTAAGYKWKYEM